MPIVTPIAAFPEPSFGARKMCKVASMKVRMAAGKGAAMKTAASMKTRAAVKTIAAMKTTTGLKTGAAVKAAAFVEAATAASAALKTSTTVKTTASVEAATTASAVKATSASTMEAAAATTTAAAVSGGYRARCCRQHGYSRNQKSHDRSAYGPPHNEFSFSQLSVLPHFVRIDCR
jgi:hypothetical protein